MPFLLSIPKHIKFIQILCLRKLKKENYLETIQKMRSGYKLRGFHVRCIFADGPFECLRHDLEREPYQIPLTTCNANQHVDFVERACEGHTIYNAFHKNPKEIPYRDRLFNSHANQFIATKRGSASNDVSKRNHQGNSTQMSKALMRRVCTGSCTRRQYYRERKSRGRIVLEAVWQ